MAGNGGGGRPHGGLSPVLYSPVGWRSWRDIAAAWESAVSKESGSAAAIKTFRNTELGETWVVSPQELRVQLHRNGIEHFALDVVRAVGGKSMRAAGEALT